MSISPPFVCSFCKEDLLLFFFWNFDATLEVEVAAARQVPEVPISRAFQTRQEQENRKAYFVRLKRICSSNIITSGESPLQRHSEDIQRDLVVHLL